MGAARSPSLYRKVAEDIKAAIAALRADGVIAIQRRPAKPAEADRLVLPAGALVYHLTRVRLLSGCPVMIERGVYPA